MTVKQLIKELKKMPPDLDVYWADHDHGLYETGGRADYLLLINKDDMNEFLNDKCDKAFQNTPQKYVCIRP